MKKKRNLVFGIFFLAAFLLAGCAGRDGETAELEDGVYTADFETDNTMFQVNEVYDGTGTLTVENGEMTIHITLGSKNIVNLYPGLAEDAQKEGAELLAPSVDTVTYSDGWVQEVYGFDIPVPELDQEFDVALIGKKGKWYDHKVRVSNPRPLTEESPQAFLSEGLQDGSYTVELAFEGGSGKAEILSPAAVVITDGTAVATLTWNSPNYDYMIVNGEKYLPINTEGNSVFEIPVPAFDEPIRVIGDTVAMSQPHEIEYTITFYGDTLKAAEETGDLSEGGKKEAAFGDLVYERSMALQYAENFSVDYYEGGYKLLSIQDGTKILLVPENQETPKDPEEGTIVLKQPIEDLYLVSSAVMDMFSALDALDTIRLSGQKEESWYIEEAKDAMAKGEILYAGKYDQPDYELIVSEHCSLAIENRMIFHSPEVMEMLNDFGIPVIVEYSSYEPHPLGRVEWIKFFGALTGKEEMADAIFAEQAAILEKVTAAEKTDRTVAFFYITSNGLVQVRQSADYIPKMIEFAGGKYVFENAGDPESGRSTMNMQIEEFYNGAKEADFIIYNSSIDGGVHSVEELIEKCDVLKDFKAVQEGNVWCTTNDMYQQSMSTGYLIEDIHRMLQGEDEEEMQYLFHLEQGRA